MTGTETNAPRTAQYLTFKVADEEYAIDVLRVREVVESMPVTRLPRMPEAIRGVVNLRGNVVPLIDLGTRFSLGERAITKWTCIVFVEVELEGRPTVMGMLVDSVQRVLELGKESIEPVPPFGTRVRLDFLEGVGIAGEDFVLLLDVDRVLEMDDLLALAGAGMRDDGRGARDDKVTRASTLSDAP